MGLSRLLMACLESWLISHRLDRSLDVDLGVPEDLLCSGLLS